MKSNNAEVRKLVLTKTEIIQNQIEFIKSGYLAPDNIDYLHQKECAFMVELYRFYKKNRGLSAKQLDSIQGIRNKIESRRRNRFKFLNKGHFLKINNNEHTKASIMKKNLREVRYKKWTTEKFNRMGERITAWDGDFIHEGWFHRWGSKIVEDENGNTQYTVAIIESTTGEIEVVPPEKIKFVNPTRDENLYSRIPTDEE